MPNETVDQHRSTMKMPPIRDYPDLDSIIDAGFGLTDAIRFFHKMLEERPSLPIVRRALASRRIPKFFDDLAEVTCDF